MPNAARGRGAGSAVGGRSEPQAARLKIAVSGPAFALVITVVKGSFERSETWSDALGGPTGGPMGEHPTCRPTRPES